MDEKEPLPEVKPQGGKNFKKVPIIIVLIVILLLILWRVGALPFGKKTAEEEVKTTEIQQPVTETPPATPTSEEETQPTPKTEELDKKTIGIRVLNGSGATGAAAKARTFLEEKGWKVLSVGNADKQDYAQSVLRLRPDAKKYQNTLKSDLSGSYTVIFGDLLEATATANVEFIVGLK